MKCIFFYVGCRIVYFALNTKCRNVLVALNTKSLFCVGIVFCNRQNALFFDFCNRQKQNKMRRWSVWWLLFGHKETCSFFVSFLACDLVKKRNKPCRKQVIWCELRWDLLLFVFCVEAWRMRKRSKPECDCWLSENGQGMWGYMEQREGWLPKPIANKPAIF